MRTDNEILARIHAVRSRDLFGFETRNLIAALSYDAARRYLREGVTREEWEDAMHVTCLEEAMLKYMPFAWSEANNRRGYSAARSIAHMITWLWLNGEEEAAESIRNYTHYGKPQLRAICEAYGWDWKQWDNGVWALCEEDSSPAPDTVRPLPLRPRILN